MVCHELEPNRKQFPTSRHTNRNNQKACIRRSGRTRYFPISSRWIACNSKPCDWPTVAMAAVASLKSEQHHPLTDSKVMKIQTYKQIKPRQYWMINHWFMSLTKTKSKQHYNIWFFFAASLKLKISYMLLPVNFVLGLPVAGVREWMKETIELLLLLVFLL